MTPVVFAPGMMCDARLFAPQVAALRNEREVAVASLAKASTITDMAENLLAEAPSRFALAGLSLGGIVAMEVIRLAPARVAGLALIDTNPLAEQVTVQSNRNRQMALVSEQGKLLDVMRDELKPNYLANGVNKTQILDLCMAMAVDLGPEVFVRQSMALQSRPDQTETLRDVKVETLVLCGDQDRLCPIERHELIHSLVTGSDLIVIPDAGHLPTLEQPNLTTNAIKTWLHKIG